MDVKTLCLGLLSFNEASGYDLKKKFESIFKHFFPAGYGSIYPALADLAEAGLVSCREITQDGRPDRKVYRITEEGRQLFAESLRTTNPQHKLRSEFLAMVYFADLMDPERLEALLDQRVRELHESLDHIAYIKAQLDGAAPAGARFVAGFGAALAQAAVDYIESHRNLLSRRAHTSARKARRQAAAAESAL
jgi:DNA-binding PadR family transcriptional regulator